MTNNRPHWADTAIAVFTGLILITYITGNWFSCQQLKLTRKALEQSQIDNAKAIAAQQAIAQQALNTSQANFTKSSQDSQNSFRDEQRAWVGVISLVGIVVKEGETPR